MAVAYTPAIDYGRLKNILRKYPPQLGVAQFLKYFIRGVRHEKETIKNVGETVAGSAEGEGKGSNRIASSVAAGICVAMDFFEHRYYRMNKILLKMIGLWPYQSVCIGRGIRIFILLIGAFYGVPEIIFVVRNRDDWRHLRETCVSWIFMAGIFVKIFYYRVNLNSKMLQLLDRIRTDWKVWARYREVNTLHEYNKQGRKLSLLYAAIIYSTGILFSIQPLVPKIIDVLLNNGSKPARFSSPVDYYFFDEQKYYVYVYMHAIITVSLGFIIIIANDTMFIVYVQHGCGLFAALGHKLERMGTNERVAETGRLEYALNKKDVNSENVAWCIQRHNDAIEYAELIESSYSWCFFFLMGLNILLISISELQIVSGKIDAQETAKYITCTIAVILHLYMENYMPQSLMDHSTRIRCYIHNGKWYRLSLKTQKSLYLMIIRCNDACKLTAGKIAIMSVETFTVILKTSMSCVTILRLM